MLSVLSRLGASLAGAAMQLLRRPGYSATVVATLALGIGAVTTVFALVHVVVLSSLPFTRADDLVMVRQQSPAGSWNTSVADFRGIAEHATTFESVAAMRTASALVGAGEQGEWRNARWVSADFFDVLGLAPQRGRAFRAEEDRPGAPNVVVLGAAFAEQRFGAQDAALGKNLLIDGVAHTVVGVMPAGVETHPVVRADFWPALQMAEPERRGPFFLATIARLRPGATREVAVADLEAVSRRLFPLWQQGFSDETAKLTPFPLRDVVMAGSADFLWIALAAVGVVLLIVLMNNANLLLMRIAQRSHDLHVRAALGASRWRLARMLVAENVLLATAGGIGGSVLAMLLLSGYRSLGPALPRLAEVGMTPAVLGLTAALALLSAIALALVPMLHGSFGSAKTLQVRSASAGKERQRVRDGLVVLEFALALPLVVAAGLLVDNLVRLQRVDAGFEPAQLLTAQVRLPPAGYADAAAQLRFWNDALPALQALPGVQGVGLAGALPPQCGCFNNFDLLARPAVGGNEPQSPWVPVDSALLKTLNVRLHEGRMFDSRDTPDSPPVVLVSQSWAARHFPGESAVGKQLYEGGNHSVAVTIVGVVGDVRFDGLDNPGVVVFAPVSQGWSAGQLYLVVRTAGDPLTAAAAIRGTLQRFDPALVPTEIETMSNLLADSIGNQRHWAAVITLFAASAAALAAIGVFGVLAYQVEQRRRELGIRQALGADRRGIVNLVMRRGLACSALGIAMGSVLALMVVRSLDVLLSQVQTSNLWAWIAAWTLLLAVGATACWVPARRAARVDPLMALRQE
jgi:putative ABC transport system permease protein